MTSTEIAHEQDYEKRHGSPRQRRTPTPIFPPEGMCFLCHEEPVLPEESFGLKCSITSDLAWVEMQLMGYAR